MTMMMIMMMIKVVWSCWTKEGDDWDKRCVAMASEWTRRDDIMKSFVLPREHVHRVREKRGQSILVITLKSLDTVP